MKICQKCQCQFNPRYIFNNTLHLLYHRKFCLTCSPFGSHNTSSLINPTPRSTIDKLSDDEFRGLIKSSNSRSDVFIKLKLRKSGESFKILNRRLNKDKIDISHFIVGGIVGGKSKKWTDENTYCNNSHVGHIRYRAFADKIMDYKCQRCLNDGMWMDGKITLELDHINGDRYDNRKENLRWLCPNCHSQTSTFCQKRRT